VRRVFTSRNASTASIAARTCESAWHQRRCLVASLLLAADQCATTVSASWAKDVRDVKDAQEWLSTHGLNGQIWQIKAGRKLVHLHQHQTPAAVRMVLPKLALPAQQMVRVCAPAATLDSPLAVSKLVVVKIFVLAPMALPKPALLAQQTARVCAPAATLDSPLTVSKLAATMVPMLATRTVMLAMATAMLATTTVMLATTTAMLATTTVMLATTTPMLETTTTLLLLRLPVLETTTPMLPPMTRLRELD